MRAMTTPPNILMQTRLSLSVERALRFTSAALVAIAAGVTHAQEPANPEGPVLRMQAQASTEAAERFYEHAREAARALSFGDVELIEASYNQSQSARPVPMARTALSAAAEMPTVPMQPGQTTVTVSFSGSLRLKR